MENEVLPLEQTDPEIAEFFRGIANGENPHGINGIIVGKNSIAINKGKGWRNWEETVIKENKVGRNDPCPYCLENGKKIKWKKCKIHNDI